MSAVCKLTLAARGGKPAGAGAAQAVSRGDGWLEQGGWGLNLGCPAVGEQGL